MKRLLLFLVLMLAATFSFASTGKDVVCNTPAQIGAVGVTDGSAAIAWSPTGATSYTLQYRLSDSTNWISVAVTIGANDSTVRRLTGLQLCKVYVVRVRANCSATESSDWSRLADFRTLGCPLPCLAPSGLFAAPRDSSATLTWLSVASTTVGRTYIVQWKSSRDTVWHTSTTSENTLVLRGLTPCNEYQYRVKTVCSNTSSSDYSETAKFKTGGCVAPCSSPRELSGRTDGTTKIVLGWASTGAVAYEVQYRIDTSQTWITVRDSTNYFQHTTTRTCTPYTFRVRSLCSTSTTMVSEWSASKTIISAGCVPVVHCEAPRRLSYVPAATSALLRWDSIAGVTYDLQWMNARDSSANPWHTVSAIHGNSYNLTGLTACTVYIFRVKTNCNASSVSGWSEPIRIQTIGCAPTCSAPRNFHAYVNDTVIVFSWERADISNYVLTVVSTDSSQPQRRISVNGFSYTLTGLARCKTWKATLQTICADNRTSEIVATAFTTITRTCPTACEPTHGLTSEITNDTVAVVTFGISTGITLQSYQVQYRIAGTTAWSSITVASNATLPLKITGLHRCTTYEWRVFKTCTTGASESEVATFTTKGCAVCNPPREVNITQGHDSTIVTWLAPTVGGTASYAYEIRVNSDIASTRAVNLSYILRGLVACRTYVISVRTVCTDGGFSSWVEKQFRIPGTNCFSGSSSDDQVEALRSNTSSVSDFTLYPNPGRDNLRVAYKIEEDAANVTIQLMNLQGQVVNQLNGGSQDAGNYVQVLENLGGLHDGFYFVVLRTNGKVVSTQKWMKQ